MDGLVPFPILAMQYHLRDAPSMYVGSNGRNREFDAD